jgi:iron uptake system component EfeO
VRRATICGLAAGAVVLLAGAAVAAASVVPKSEATVRSAAIAVNAGISGCGTGWSHGTAGRLRFEVRNTSIAGMEVYLQAAGAVAEQTAPAASTLAADAMATRPASPQPTSGGASSAQPVYLDLESIGASATVRGDVTLAAGRYRFVCLPADEDPIAGPIVTVTGAAHVANATPGIVPVTQNDLIPAAKRYGAWIESRLPVLQREAAALEADVASADLQKARTDWLAAHLEYESLGAAYGAFGEADTAINGMPASGRTALDDPHLTGFHKIEALLWSGAGASELAPFTKRHVADVGDLRTDFPHARVDPLDIGLRAHEILENALQFELTGAADAGSHTDLATVDANLTGTERALAPLRGILTSRYPDLGTTDAALAASRTLVESFRGTSGTWTPVQRLTTAQRERVDAQIDRTVELLAPIAAICDVRRSAS